MSVADKRRDTLPSLSTNKVHANGERDKSPIVLKKEELGMTEANAQMDVDRYRNSLLAPIAKSTIEIAKQLAAEKGIDSGRRFILSHDYGSS